jgi:hypothetical protein
MESNTYVQKIIYVQNQCYVNMIILYFIFFAFFVLFVDGNPQFLPTAEYTRQTIEKLLKSSTLEHAVNRKYFISFIDCYIQKLSYIYYVFIFIFLFFFYLCIACFFFYSSIITSKICTIQTSTTKIKCNKVINNL